MVLATQPKARPTAHHKKRHGQHQKQTKHYLKTYWPYLPVVALGFLANIVLTISMSAATLTNPASIETPTRLDIWTNANAWLTIAFLAVVGIAAVLLISKHARAWQRVVVHSEEFVIKHKTLDVLLLIVAVAGVVATRTIS